jgi:hypothetical protein
VREELPKFILPEAIIFPVTSNTKPEVMEVDATPKAFLNIA